MTWSVRITDKDGIITNSCHNCKRRELPIENSVGYAKTKWCQLSIIGHEVGLLLTMVDVLQDGFTASGAAELRCCGFELKEKK